MYFFYKIKVLTVYQYRVSLVDINYAKHKDYRNKKMKKNNSCTCIGYLIMETLQKQPNTEITDNSIILQF